MMAPSYLFCVVAISLMISFTRGSQADVDQTGSSNQLRTIEPNNNALDQEPMEDSLRQETGPTNTQTKFIKPQVLAALVQPFQERLGAFVNSLSQPGHPNNPQFLNPLQIWQKVQESGNKFFAGLQDALGNSQNTDYPVPFRNARSKPVTFIN